MSVSGQQVVDQARTYLGVPYRYGGTNRSGIDCSALVQQSLAKLGITAPRTAAQQWHWSKKITADQLQPGDLIFEKGSDGTETRPGHVMIYAGGGQVVEAPHTGLDVRVRKWSPNESGIVGYGRPVGMKSATGAGSQPASWSGGLLQWPQEVAGAAGTVEDFFSKMMWLVNPENWVRIIAGIIGVLLAAGAIALMASSA